MKTAICSIYRLSFLVTDNTHVHKARCTSKWLFKFGVEELDQHVQSPEDHQSNCIRMDVGLTVSQVLAIAWPHIVTLNLCSEHPTILYKVFSEEWRLFQWHINVHHFDEISEHFCKNLAFTNSLIKMSYVMLNISF